MTHSHQAATAITRDPVCGMTVEKEKTAHKTVHEGRNALALVRHGKEFTHHLRVKTSAGFRPKVLNHLVFRDGRTIAAPGAHGVPYIDDGEDSGFQRNFFAF